MTTTITARVDSEKKRAAEAIFNDIGMTLSGAINVFINEVVMYQGIPFQLRRRPSVASRMEAIMDGNLMNQGLTSGTSAGNEP